VTTFRSRARFALLFSFVIGCIVVDAFERIWAVLVGEFGMRLFEKIKQIRGGRIASE
jgi:hypothetical protein